jgi:antitoxin component YwqK of YwqJK toxin-antitoxin module
MKQTLLIITALMLIVGCSSDPIDGSTLVRKDGLYYASDANEPYSGVAVWYHENGQKSDERTYKDGEFDGISTLWYENGQKEYEGTWKDGKEDGLETWWYKNGQKWEKSTYKDGERIESTSWDKYGNKK